MSRRSRGRGSRRSAGRQVAAAHGVAEGDDELLVVSDLLRDRGELRELGARERPVARGEVEDDRLLHDLGLLEPGSELSARDQLEAALHDVGPGR